MQAVVESLSSNPASLNELERTKPFVPQDATSLVKKVCNLRQKPLRDYSIEDLRLMINQGEGLNYLLPMALAVLAEDPLAEGDFYPGDLLSAVISNEKFLLTADRNYRDAVLDAVKAALDDERFHNLRAVKRNFERFLENSK